MRLSSSTPERMSGVGNHRYCELLSAAILPYPEDTVSLWFFPTPGSYNCPPIVSAMVLEPWGRVCDINVPLWLSMSQSFTLRFCVDHYPLHQEQDISKLEEHAHTLPKHPSSNLDLQDCLMGAYN